MVNWCCCCYEMLLLMIHAMGIHNYEVVVWIEFLFGVFMKDSLNWWIVLKWHWISSLICFESLLVYINLNKLWGRIWVFGESKLEFLGEKWWKTRKHGMKVAWSSLMASSVWKQLAYSQKLTKSELLNDSFPCFAFLRLFHTFLFWIGLWCKHECFG